MTETAIAIGGLVLALITAIVQLAYKAGRQETRIDKLEEWRVELREDIQGIHGHIERLASARLATADDAPHARG